MMGTLTTVVITTVVITTLLVVGKWLELLFLSGY